ncbi:helix-turn-helix domain-containing protein [Bacteroides xylanisolvens]|nr:helix-turn-helix domain-containing protein [Bacteroides xylanisolvens]
MDNEKLKERGCTPLEDLISEDFGVPGTAERYEFENSCEAFIIGEQLRAERLKAGMTQEQLAAKIGTQKKLYIAY